MVIEIEKMGRVRQTNQVFDDEGSNTGRAPLVFCKTGVFDYRRLPITHFYPLWFTKTYKKKKFLQSNTILTNDKVYYLILLEFQSCRTKRLLRHGRSGTSPYIEKVAEGLI